MHQATVRLQKMEIEQADRCFYFLLDPGNDDAVAVAVRVPEGVDRNETISALAERGIGTSVHFIPLHLQPFWREFGGHDPSDFPAATAAFDRVISLPIFSSMREHEINRVIESVRNIASQWASAT